MVKFRNFNPANPLSVSCSYFQKRVLINGFNGFNRVAEVGCNEAGSASVA
jgi:hypothetical protein